MKVSESAIVSLRFKLMNSKNEILENTMEGPAIQYLHGSGNILGALEGELLGLTAGDSKRIFISKDQGYDESDDDFMVDVIIDEVRWATEEELANGKPALQNLDNNCGPDCIC